MAAGDPLLHEVSKRALLQSLREPDPITYRQQVLGDGLEHPTVVRELYALAGEALKAEKSVWGGIAREYPRTLLSNAVQKMELFLGFLRRLRKLTDDHAGTFASAGFSQFFETLVHELDEEYFELVQSQLEALRFKGGMLVSAGLGPGNKGREHVLRRPRAHRLLERVFDRSGYSFTIPERDDSGFRALSELEDKGANLVANALAQAVDHVHSFFVMLQAEMGFYVACLNLEQRLAEKGEPTAFPQAAARGALALSGASVYDVALALTATDPVVGNDVHADRKSLVMITGANQGGKSTFLRALGLAQLMTQSGMFVGAESLRVNVCDGLFTHFKREEDQAMESGKLDEELARMSDIANHLKSGCVLLCNESFGSTNEREGSQIARQVVNALLSEGVKVLFVTHLFDLASGFVEQQLPSALFLRAERGSGDARPFKVSEGAPLPTSYGEESYKKVFRRGLDATSAGSH